MNGKCLDIGTIQAFLDGETRPEDAVRISDHVAACDPCSLLLAQAEEENSLVFSVLDREMNTLVPTQRLWTRINAEITEEKSHASVWQRFLGTVAASLASPSFAGAAGLVIMVGLLSIVWVNSSGSEAVGEVAGVSDPQTAPIQTTEEPVSAHVAITTGDPEIPVGATSKPTVRITHHSPEEIKRMIQPAKYTETGPRRVTVAPVSAPQFLPGEESYIKTINELQEGVTIQSASLKASSQVAFHRDLAVVEDAISKMRRVVRKNPRNQAARQILYSAYQDKIDLLKSSAQRNELMASVQ